MLLKDKLAAFAVVFIWGINFYFMKVGVSEIHPMLLGCLRYLLVLLPAPLMAHDYVVDRMQLALSP